MDEYSYLRGAEDILDILVMRLHEKRLDYPEVIEEIEYLISIIKEDKVNVLKKHMGIL